jgi:WD40 repeat protein
VKALALSADGKVLASADKKLLLWSLPAGTLSRTIEDREFGGARPRVALSPDGKTVVWGNYKVVTLWDSAGGERVGFLSDHKEFTYWGGGGDPVWYDSSGSSSGSSTPTDRRCTCNKVCTCVPVRRRR